MKIRQSNVITGFMGCVIVLLLITIPHSLVKGRNPNMPMKNQNLDLFCQVAEEVESKRHKKGDNLKALQLRLCHSLL